MSFKCKQCPKFFLEEEDLYVHQVSHKQVSTFSTALFKNDSVNNDTVKPSENSPCIYILLPSQSESNNAEVTEDNTIKDKLSQAGYEEHNSEIGTKSSAKSFYLNQRKKTHDTEERYSCEICGQEFLQNWYLKKHLLVHTGEKPHGCEICQEHFRHKYQLVIHRMSHTGEKPYECVICNKGFVVKKQLKMHELSHEKKSNKSCRENRERCVLPLKGKKFKCEICDKLFSRKKHLMRHYLIHTKESPYQCEVCGESFAQSYRLKAHMEIHIIQPYTCIICSKDFSSQSKLNIHSDIHIIKQQHTCGVCSKDFSSQSELNAHKEIHIIKQQHICGICSKEFSSQSELHAHREIHILKQPYTCGICLQFFSNQSKLNAHKFLHVLSETDGQELRKDYLPPKSLNDDVALPIAGERCESDTNKIKVLEKQSLESHIKVHSEENLHKQEIVEIGTSQKLPFITDTCRVSENKTQICGVVFSDIVELTNHKLVHLEDTSRDVCKKEVSEKQHSGSHSEEKSPKHEFVEISSSENLPLIIDAFTVSQNNPQTCEVCGVFFSDIAEWTDHKLSHLKGTSNIRDICKKEVSKEQRSESHLKAHSEEQPPKHEFVEISYSENLSSIIDAFTVSKNNPQTCEVCRVFFSDITKWTNHKLFHLRDTSHIDDICKKEVSKEQHLESNLKAYSEENHHKQEIDKIGSFENSPLIIKAFTVSENKTQACEVCGVFFSDVIELTNHKLSHLKKTSYTCDFCDKNFFDKNLLENHVKAHSEEKLRMNEEEKNNSLAHLPIKIESSVTVPENKAYTCQICNLSFLDTVCLGKHLASKHKISSKRKIRTNFSPRKKRTEKPYFCEICEERFVTETNLDIHKRYICKPDEAIEFLPVQHTYLKFKYK